MWETALKLRNEVANTTSNHSRNLTPVSYFQYAVEVTSVDSLRQTTSPNDLYMQALLKYSRIYGENHPVTIGKIIFRGALYGDNGCYQRCVELWKYAYTLRLKQDDPLNADTIQSAISLVDMICELETRWVNKKTTEQGNADIMKYLLDECDPDVEQKGLFKLPTWDNGIEAPSLWCATGLENGLDIIKLLTEHGADVNGLTSVKSTPLISACGSLNMPMVEYLVEHGANIRNITEKGYSCLMAAVANTELCAYLISKGASVNASSVDGYTALHHAAYSHKLETVKLLCRNGGSMTAKTNYEETPLQIAALRGRSTILKYFLDTYEFPVEEKCDAFDLIGCFLVDDDVTNFCQQINEKLSH
ncbi:unnamed protein product [Mytilus edulis]|uniref:Protein fem-1 homolog B n=1 Tax=Mytilus edulis TaxID=6550 RepID=A0A8S3U934_MYTED|nr:unnamed protein product [Mytilus edulis]